MPSGSPASFLVRRLLEMLVEASVYPPAALRVPALYTGKCMAEETGSQCGDLVGWLQPSFGEELLN